MEELYLAWREERAAHPGKLPVVVLDDTVAIVSGSGEKQSTNYKPVFRIVQWAPRGDLAAAPKTAPLTGTAESPKAKEPALADADDFG